MNSKHGMEVIMLSIFTAAETAHAFSAFMPSHFTIRTFALEGDAAAVQVKLGNLRSGYLPAIMFGLLLGGVVSVLARSPLPLMAAAATDVVMVLNYEAAIPAELRDPGAALVLGPARNGRPAWPLP